MQTTGENNNIIKSVKRVSLMVISYIILIAGFNSIIFYFLFALFIFRKIEYSTLITCLCVIIMYDIYRLICKYCICKYIPVNTMKVTTLLLPITIIGLFLCYLVIHYDIMIEYIKYILAFIFLFIR